MLSIGIEQVLAVLKVLVWNSIESVPAQFQYYQYQSIQCQYYQYQSIQCQYIHTGNTFSISIPNTQEDWFWYISKRSGLNNTDELNPYEKAELNRIVLLARDPCHQNNVR